MTPALGRFFTEAEDEQAAPVCVLGEGAKTNLFGPRDVVGEYVKINEQWFRIVGVAAPQLSLDSGVGGLAGSLWVAVWMNTLAAFAALLLVRRKVARPREPVANATHQK